MDPKLPAGEKPAITAEFSDQLRRLVGAAARRLRSMDEAAAARKPAPEKWSRKEILGHLIDSAANNHQRFVRALLADELRFPGYEQVEWARCQDHAHADWGSLITLWQSYNEHLAFLAARIPLEKLSTPCRIGETDPVALGSLLEGYLQHLNHHLRQLES